MTYEQLKLDNQLCFPIYAASRLITRAYQPHLDALGITYPQYLVLMVLWETDGLSVHDISVRLILNTNTLTPLLKRMEAQGLVTRTRSSQDERVVRIQLSAKGKALREEAADIPLRLNERLQESNLNLEQLLELKSNLHRLIEFLGKD
ncbi:MAG: MarR family transcriptional regulator [Bacteroidales bacterium]|nr:MarR family transcriptional regulator [Bacteroidales bacterium]MDD3166673.1 MarR family transcriptional regulator [Bacteroidales bacterium]MDD4771915.1 MarR family transcriptional regulator [Bacteroidales bacterium]